MFVSVVFNLHYVVCNNSSARKRNRSKKASKTVKERDRKNKQFKVKDIFIDIIKLSVSVVT